MTIKKRIMNRNYQEITEIFRYASEQASTKINEIYRSDFSVSNKKNNTPLTTADLESNRILLDILKKELKNIPIVSEEAPIPIKKSFNEFVLLDPLDGTKEFIKKNGEFSVNIALIQKNQPVIGVIELPAKNIQYFSNGENSYKSTQNIVKKISVKEHKNYIFAVSRSHLDDSTINFLNDFKKKKIIKIGSSLKLCLIAEGLADFYIRYGNTMEWDIAAGHSILRTAGGDIFNIKLSSLKYKKKDFLNSTFIAFNKPKLEIINRFLKFYKI